MTGEADEDTMSAWSSLNGGGGGSGTGLGSPSEIGPTLSLRRRSSFGMQMASFSEDPALELQSDHVTLDAELAEVGRGGVEGDGKRNTFGDVALLAKEEAEGQGRREAGPASRREESVPIVLEVDTETATAAQSNGDGTVPSSDHKNGVNPSSPQGPKDRGEVPSAAAVGPLVNTTNSPTEETFVAAPPSNRRRSNQDDQSNHSDSDGGSSSITGGGSVRGEDAEASRGRGSEFAPPFNKQGSVESGGSDARCANVGEMRKTIPLTLRPPLGS